MTWRQDCKDFAVVSIDMTGDRWYNNMADKAWQIGLCHTGLGHGPFLKVKKTYLPLLVPNPLRRQPPSIFGCLKAKYHFLIQAVLVGLPEVPSFLAGKCLYNSPHRFLPAVAGQPFHLLSLVATFHDHFFFFYKFTSETVKSWALVNMFKDEIRKGDRL